MFRVQGGGVVCLGLLRGFMSQPTQVQLLCLKSLDSYSTSIEEWAVVASARDRL